MLRGYLRSFRYSRAWARGGQALEARELSLGNGANPVAATCYRPVHRPHRLPLWVVLHGVTRPGRAHPTLIRFARALASSPAVVVCPEVAQWRALSLAPEAAVPLIKRAVVGASELPEVEPGRAGLIGFSFGAPQALAAAADPKVARHLSCVAGFGGFFDLEHTLRFLFTGWYEWEGEERYRRPDPYGRWIVGANYLAGVPDWSPATDVAEALLRLATAAGDRRIDSWDPSYNPFKQELRSGVAPARQHLFDLFAPPDCGDPSREESEPIVQGLANAIRRASEAMEPKRYVDRLTIPVHLVHGRSDHLIPYTETLRAGEALRPHVPVRATITGLFSHAQVGEEVGNPVVEGVRLFRALAGMLSGA